MAVLMLTGVCVDPSHAASTEQVNAYVLGPDDELTISVFGEEGLSGTTRVGADGYISLPLIGPLYLQGKTTEDVENLIRIKLMDGYLVDPSVSVSVKTYRPFYILGEVRTPGPYTYVSNMDALTAIALAGGFTYRAQRKYVKILRNGVENSQKYDLDTSIYPGDVVVVKERFF